MLSMEMGGLRFSFLFSIFITSAVVSSSGDSGTPDILKVLLRLYCSCSSNFSSIDFICVFTRGQYWPSGIVVACVCLCVCVSVRVSIKSLSAR